MLEPAITNAAFSHRHSVPTNAQDLCTPVFRVAERIDRGHKQSASGHPVTYLHCVL